MISRSGRQDLIGEPCKLLNPDAKSLSDPIQR